MAGDRSGASARIAAVAGHVRSGGLTAADAEPARSGGLTAAPSDAVDRAEGSR